MDRPEQAYVQQGTGPSRTNPQASAEYPLEPLAVLPYVIQLLPVAVIRVAVWIDGIVNASLTCSRKNSHCSAVCGARLALQIPAYHSPESARASFGDSDRPSPFRWALMLAMRLSISVSHSRCFARASAMGVPGGALKRASHWTPYSRAYSDCTSSGMRLRLRSRRFWWGSTWSLHEACVALCVAAPVYFSSLFNKMPQSLGKLVAGAVERTRTSTGCPASTSS